MPELRKDPVIGRWVIISTERGKRPLDFSGRPKRANGGFCPFCEGNEDKTPPEIYAAADRARAPDGEGWQVRVVPNKFPALRIEGDLGRAGVGLYDMMNGVGAHEVIIESPNHNDSLADLDDKGVAAVLKACQVRMRDLQQDQRFRYILIFKNYGEEAGASLEHSHTQLIATPIVPKRVQEELDGARQHFLHKERCIFCDIIDQELSAGSRLIEENEAFVSFAPYAARFPFETWILPRKHGAQFQEINSKERGLFARILRSTLRRLDVALEDPAYNFVLHTAPVGEKSDAYYHWHLELMPKLTKVAGFEWGTGFYINPTPPEVSAEFMRELVLSGDS